MARYGSRAIMNAEESGVRTLPRPTPASCARDLAMPSLVTFGERVRSISWACAADTLRTNAPVAVRKRKTDSIERRELLAVEDRWTLNLLAWPAICWDF